MGNSAKGMLLPAVFLVLGTVLGVFLAKLPVLNLQPSSQTAKASPLFKTQLATMEGSVTQVSGSQISVKNSQGQTAQFMASKKLVVFKKDSKTTLAQSIPGTSAIELDKNASFVLELEDNQFKITSIHYGVQKGK